MNCSKRICLSIVFIILLSFVLGACTSNAGVDDEIDFSQEGSTVVPAETAEMIRPEGWSEDSHGDDSEPNYDVVFPDDEVLQITITISPDDWLAMQADLTELLGDAGTAGQGGFDRGGNQQPGNFQPQPGEGTGPTEGTQPAAGERPDRGQPPEGQQPQQQERQDVGGGGIRDGEILSDNPMWVSATIEFEGQVWTHVGVRFKGNSSLASGWRSGTLKLPLKLDFDQFEDLYPEIDNQRFFGFKQLSLANGFSDDSFLRDAATYQILEDAGLPAAQTAFYEVFLDYGEGPVSLGLYTVIEVIDDTVVENYFGSTDGNIYEGEGSAASFAASTYDLIEDSFQKENNEDAADWSDIETLFEVLHSDLRIGDPAAWRAELEVVFNVDGFLEWLAISAAIQHWDAYGSMSHNYYLYNDPATGQLSWISWDHNMTMMGGGGMGGGGRGGGMGQNVSLDKSDVGDNWPLIRFLLDDPVYYERYLDFLDETISGPYNPEHMEDLFRSMAELIEPYAAADVGLDAFESAVQQLIDLAYQREEAVEAFLAEAGR